MGEMNRSVGFRQSKPGENVTDVLTVANDTHARREPVRMRPPQSGHSQEPIRGGSTQNRLSERGLAYQSSLLSRYVKQPSMPSSNSIHNALGFERSNGWPTLAPVRQTVREAPEPKGSGFPPSRIPRPSQKGVKSSKSGRTGGVQNQSRPNPGMQISYQNEYEIMKRIFGNSYRYANQVQANAVKRTASDTRFQNLDQPLDRKKPKIPSPSKKKTPNHTSGKMALPPRMPPKMNAHEQQLLSLHKQRMLDFPSPMQDPYGADAHASPSLDQPGRRKQSIGGMSSGPSTAYAQEKVLARSPVHSHGDPTKA